MSSCLNSKNHAAFAWPHTYWWLLRAIDLVKWQTRSVNLETIRWFSQTRKCQKLFINRNRNAEFRFESNAHRFFTSHTHRLHTKYSAVNCEAWIVRSEPIHSFIIQLTCKCIRSIVMNWWASRGLELKNSETISAIAVWTISIYSVIHLWEKHHFDSIP